MREVIVTITDELLQIKLDYLRSIGVNITELIEQAILGYEPNALTDIINTRRLIDA